MKTKILVMKILTCITSVSSCIAAILFFSLPDNTPINIVYKFLVVMIGCIAMAMISGSCLDALRRR